MSGPLMKRLAATDCEVTVDGEIVAARRGETVAALLMSSGSWGEVYCGMGVCFTCLVTIDGNPGRRACLEVVVDGMRIETAKDGRDG